MQHFNEYDLIGSNEYATACKEIRPLVPYDWLLSDEAKQIRLTAKTPADAIAALKARAYEIKAGTR